MNVFVLTGEHYHIPGVGLSVYASKDGAIAEARKFVNIMVKDTVKQGYQCNISETHWERRLQWVQDIQGAAHCYVDISEHEVKD